MIEKEKKSERLDYLDNLPHDFRDFILESKAIHESQKLDTLVGLSNNFGPIYDNKEQIKSQNEISKLKNNQIKNKIKHNDAQVYHDNYDLENQQFDSYEDDKYNFKALPELNSKYENANYYDDDDFIDKNESMYDNCESNQEEFHDEDYHSSYDYSIKNCFKSKNNFSGSRI